MQLRHLLAASTALTALAGLAAAQGAALPPADYVLPEITLYAYQTEAELGRTGATVEVVTQEELQRDGTLRLTDYLATLPGISATANGGFGTQSTLRIRGLAGQYVKVLVDGIDVSDPSSTQIRFDPGAMMTGDIARIEVLKGAQSALYGSEAIGGVIAISTLDATEPGTRQRATLEYGSYNTKRAAYSITTSGERHALAFTVQHLDTDGFSVADEADGNREDDGARATRATLSGRYDVNDALTIGAAGFWQKTEAETDGDFPVLEDGADASNGILRGGRIYADYDAGGIRHGLALQRSETSRQETYDGFTYPFEGERTELEYKGSVDLNPQVVLAWGAAHSREEFQGDSTDAGYITNSAFAEARYTPNDRLDLALSLRHDHNSQFGSEATGRLALAWRPDDNWTLRANWGTGYRAPSPYELYSFWAGTPDLTPETAKGGEIGVERSFANGATLRATAFHSVVTDLIDYSYATFHYEQIPGDTRSQGIELSGETPLNDRLRLSGNFTYTDTERPDGQQLERVPERVLNLRLDGDISDRSRFGLGLTHASGLVDRGAEMPSYTLVDASVEYDLTGRSTGYLRVENLFDQDYQVLRGYGTSGRALFAGIRAEF
ncbi:TonB-dependent receptor plug domain-containing protein [Paracoccus zhejiangensis]|uniref:TonB-dependent receptor n=1 Tax=Paracoccus zhejiangensis TaxID=1077935 RepID=A0A2H5EXD4_9RHOB|nr:TonB-dependent receptor [Paracoccus zhejiangensis]AUH63962.1 TonB-dependent receptor [Paracoccus zhejiangensis]